MGLPPTHHSTTLLPPGIVYSHYGQPLDPDMTLCLASSLDFLLTVYTALAAYQLNDW